MAIPHDDPARFFSAVPSPVDTRPVQLDSSPTLPDHWVIAASLATDEVGDARLFHILFAGRIVYAPDTGWHIWDGTGWASKDASFIHLLIAQHVGTAYQFLWERQVLMAHQGQQANIEYEPEIVVNRVSRRLKKFYRLGRLTNVATLARTLFGVNGGGL